MLLSELGIINSQTDSINTNQRPQYRLSMLKLIIACSCIMAEQNVHNIHAHWCMVPELIINTYIVVCHDSITWPSVILEKEYIKISVDSFINLCHTGYNTQWKLFTQYRAYTNRSLCMKIKQHETFFTDENFPNYCMHVNVHKAITSL